MTEEKKVVLIVDDEDMFLRTVGDGFAPHADRITVITAPNGKAASEIVDRQHVDLVVTDLKMPELDGFGLIAHLSRAQPQAPVIVMTAFGTPDIESRLEGLGVVQYLDKPFDFQQLAQKVFDTLSASTNGHLTGIALPTVLQMIEMDRKTCTVQVHENGSDGRLFFRNGRLVDAVAGDLGGLDAATEIACWKHPEIDILSGPMKHDNRLDASVTQVLLDAFRLEDERLRSRQREERKTQSPATPAEPTGAPAVAKAETKSPDVAGGVSGAVKKTTDGAKAVSPGVSAAAAVGVAPALRLTPITTITGNAPAAPPREHDNERGRMKEISSMTVQEKLKELTTIDGYTGAGVYTPQGEVLATHGGTEIANFKEIGVLANNVLMNAQKASLDMGTGRGQQVHVEAENAQIIVRCLNEGTDPLRSQPGKAHIHMVVVLKNDASIGMAKLRTNSVIQKLAEDFRF